MTNPLKLRSLWRVVREVDLEALRVAARARFTIAVAAGTREEAARLRALLSHGDPDAPAAPHPWLEVLAAADEDPAALTPNPWCAMLVTRDPDLGPHLRRAGNHFANAGVPILTVVIGDTSHVAKVLRAGERARVAVPALDAAALDPIAGALIGLVSEDQQIAMAAHLPPLRPAVFALTIERTARANASFALTTGLAETIPVLTAPLNLGDIVVLTKNQLMMCYRIALAAGRDEEPRRMMGEIIGVLGGGVLFRQIARQLVGLIPIAGLLPKVAVAYAGTYAIGRAMAAWTLEGRQITVETVTRFSREGLERGRALAQHLVEDDAAKEGRPRRRFERLRKFLPGRSRQ
jgi:uncharacterized protein (DUF697 family)